MMRRTIEREYAPGIKNPEEFGALVKKNGYYHPGWYTTPDARGTIDLRRIRIEGFLETGDIGFLRGSLMDTWDKDRLKTEHAVLTEILLLGLRTVNNGS